MTQPDILGISLITWRTCAHTISTPATHQLQAENKIWTSDQQTPLPREIKLLEVVGTACVSLECKYNGQMNQWRENAKRK